MTMLCLVIAALNIALTSGYPSGAPNSACSSMIPQHYHDPQIDVAPYYVELSKYTYSPGETIEVYLRSNFTGLPFRGIMVQVHSNQGVNPIGSFLQDPNEETRPICNDNTGVTQNSSPNRTAMNVQWRAPPMSLGDLTVRVTFVQRIDTFWVGVTSRLLREEVTFPNSLPQQPPFPTEAPATQPPPPTQPPATQPPTTQPPPPTEASSTQPPSPTQPPTTQPPLPTQAPTTQPPPPTQPPTTQAPPPTQPPVTQPPPPTQPPVTQPPPPTEAPTTQPPPPTQPPVTQPLATQPPPPTQPPATQPPPTQPLATQPPPPTQPPATQPPPTQPLATQPPPTQPPPPTQAPTVRSTASSTSKVLTNEDDQQDDQDPAGQTPTKTKNPTQVGSMDTPGTTPRPGGSAPRSRDGDNGTSSLCSSLAMVVFVTLAMSLLAGI